MKTFTVGDEVVVEPGRWSREEPRRGVVESVGIKWVRLVRDPHGQWCRTTGENRDLGGSRIWTLDAWADIQARRALLIAIRKHPVIRTADTGRGDIGADLATLRRVAEALGIEPDIEVVK